MPGVARQSTSSTVSSFILDTANQIYRLASAVRSLHGLWQHLKDTIQKFQSVNQDTNNHRVRPNNTALEQTNRETVEAHTVEQQRSSRPRKQTNYTEHRTSRNGNQEPRRAS